MFKVNLKNYTKTKMKCQYDIDIMSRCMAPHYCSSSEISTIKHQFLFVQKRMESPRCNSYKQQ